VTRIVAGDAGGRSLVVPPGNGTRPTTERAREGLFNTVATLLDLTGARVLDLFAGSGAVGLEALSRGAAHALLVEADARAAKVIRTNARTLHLKAQVVPAKVERVLATAPDEPYDLVFLDPPYALGDTDLDRIVSTVETWLGKDGVIVVERDRRSRSPQWPDGIEAVKARSYGDSTLWYGRRS
jgi:16S rRNA (guanine966-N2)-methyltransferase